jgi:endonuclease YncB( thermonuclease family)
MNLLAFPPLAPAWHQKRALCVFCWVVRQAIGATLAGLLLVLPVASLAGTITGKVVGVADGDTITVLDADKVQHKIRLAGIDAPEKKQAFGNRSKESLSDLVFDKRVTVETEKRDRFGREIGKVLVNGRDVNLVQVESGMAWFYRQYQREQSPNDRRLYEAAEDAAKAGKRGLWRDVDPTPPWDFRKANAKRGG